MSTTEKRLVEMGWGKGSARIRAEIIDAGRVGAAGVAAGVPDMHFVAVEYSACSSHARQPAEGFVVGGRLQVGGCTPSPGTVGRLLSRPYRITRNDYSTTGDRAGVLADGTEVVMGEADRGVYSYAAGGRAYPSVMAAAMELTPA
jgi:hypothetical protein